MLQERCEQQRNQEAHPRATTGCRRRRRRAAQSRGGCSGARESHSAGSSSKRSPESPALLILSPCQRCARAGALSSGGAARQLLVAEALREALPRPGRPASRLAAGAAARCARVVDAVSRVAVAKRAARAGLQGQQRQQVASILSASFGRWSQLWGSQAPRALSISARVSPRAVGEALFLKACFARSPEARPRKMTRAPRALSISARVSPRAIGEALFLKSLLRSLLEARSRKNDESSEMTQESGKRAPTRSRQAVRAGKRGKGGVSAKGRQEVLLVR